MPVRSSNRKLLKTFATALLLVFSGAAYGDAVEECTEKHDGPVQ
jgi:hypothetical protein